ncbi:hypothetical protein HG772_000228 [Salmonella enterica]|nr:hypothetical protein [Salmonella enterica]ECZ5385821.1 hypothetical protein [Salmonella enterica subsp. enterica serovar Montevideo]EFS0969298.1 hypothetical protein [Salmonella enterica]EGG9433594.1 hypothetical protein [Salmonella enterica]EGU0348077.1 hypothetical protein [Salmonella enterica]
MCMGFYKRFFLLIPFILVSSYANAGYALVNPLQSEVSGILRQKLIDMRATAAVATATIEAFSETSVSYAAALAAEYGVSVSSMSWGTVAYGLGIPALSLAAGTGIGVFSAKVLLHQNGYDLFFPEPAMSPSGHGYWWGLIRTRPDNVLHTVIATNPWTAVNELYSYVTPDDGCGLSPGSIALYSNAASYFYNNVCLDSDKTVVRRPGSVTVDYSYSYPIVTSQPLYCDSGQVAVYSDGKQECKAAAGGNFFNKGATVVGGYLAPESVSAVMNGIVGQMSSSSLADYKGVPPDKLKITPADVETYRKHNAVSSDSYSFFLNHSQWNDSFGIPLNADGDYNDSMNRPAFNPPVPVDGFKPVPVPGTDTGSTTGTGTDTGTSTGAGTGTATGAGTGTDAGSTTGTGTATGAGTGADAGSTTGTGTATGTGTGTATGSGTSTVSVNVHVDNTIDWGTHPDTAAPELTPDTPESFITPLWDMWPAARDFKISPRLSRCPTASFDLWGKTFIIDAQCQLIDKPDVKKIISAFMLAFYALIALRIILEA